MRGSWITRLASLCYAAVFLTLVTTDRVRFLLAPRYIPVLLAASALFLLFAITGAPAPKDGMLAFFLPLLFLPGIYTARFPEASGSQAVSIVNKQKPAVQRQEEAEEAIPQEGPIVLDQEHYYSWYQALYDHHEAYMGREITVDGFIHTGAGLQEGQVLLGRMLMWCCAADALTIGFLIHNPEVLPAITEESQWYRITGRITETSYYNPSTGESYRVPAIETERCSPIPTPELPWVYPDL
ncbi:TIGR03943 family putative permease subunit [Sediminispirochaeta bajacaliforniensis]|uniref:TIGR03943 family putative permease subunit n=1 Tax=Sediminispirochaeta bajacaliforniensis TaxID=148 RepID=UPI000381EEC9|nr:TIGR03943 family protein [Sediminispirochaeta bajacaliforniensis]